MSVLCYYNDEPRVTVPTPEGLTKKQICRYRAAWMIRKKSTQHPGVLWELYEWSADVSKLPEGHRIRS